MVNGFLAKKILHKNQKISDYSLLIDILGGKAMSAQRALVQSAAYVCFPPLSLNAAPA
jgi:hypothetical protein